MSASRLLIPLVLVVFGCQQKTEDETTVDTPVAVPSAADSAEAVAAPDTTALDLTISRIPPKPGTGESRPIVAPRRQLEEAMPTVTVREVLDSNALVGRRVWITGRCLGYSATEAVGGPPLTRSDWQFEDGGRAIYVSGRLPEGCSSTEGSTKRTVILALVAQDTLPSLGNRPATPRRYLLRLMP